MFEWSITREASWRATVFGTLPQQLLFQIAYDLPHVGIHFHAVFDQPARMQNRTVIATAESLADRAERSLRHVTREEHRDLPRERNILRPAFAGHVRQPDIKMFRHFLLDQ